MIEHIAGRPNRFRVVQTIVYCPGCKEWINTVATELHEIEEGDRGQDRMTFKCEVCNTVATSDVRRA